MTATHGLGNAIRRHFGAHWDRRVYTQGCLSLPSHETRSQPPEVDRSRYYLITILDRQPPDRHNTTHQSALALKQIFKATRPFVLVHEVARPLATPELFARVLTAAQEFSVACPCAPASRRDAVAITDGDFFGEALPLDRVVWTPTPQAFRREILTDALRIARENGWEDASVPPVCVQAGYCVRMIAGERENLKIAFREDWDLARVRLGY